jgi:outer membrane receptor protein involved in Fe transport
MKAKQLIVAAILGASSVAGAFLVEERVASAQSTTTGALQGTVKEESNGEALVGVTVVASSSSMQGTQTAITDENGFYKITNLPPGDYIVTFYYADLEVRRSGVKVGVQKTSPVYQKLNTTGAGEKIEVVGTTPTIDPTSTSQGITLDQEYTKNIPIPGRTFEAALGAAAGSQGDDLGVAFSGSTSLENQYYVDGVNTTGLGFGTIGSPVINDFIEEIEVITGGYNAEFGRSTGGIVNVVTKSGSNDFKGSVFGYITPGALVAGRERNPTQASPIDAVSNLGYDTDFGFEVGGPILRDRVWFYVGVAPRFQSQNIDRNINSHRDCQIVLDTGELSDCRPWVNGADDPLGMNRPGFADQQADINPETGFYITDAVETRQFNSASRQINSVGKINFLVTPEHQGQVSAIFAPYHADIQGVYGAPQLNQFNQDALTYDVSFKWTSKFNDNKTEVELVAGWHHDQVQTQSKEDSLNNVMAQQLIFGTLGTWSDYQSPIDGSLAESNVVHDRCADGTGVLQGGTDPYPLIANCPDEGFGYSIGGPGANGKTVEDRRSIKLSVTQRLKALGSHEIKIGGDVEDNLYRNDRIFSGGAFVQNLIGGYVHTIRWVQLSDADEARFDNQCRDSTTGETYTCDYLEGTEGYPGTTVNGRTFNWSAYARDSWQILPNLTLNAGVRYEEQRLRYADHLQGTVDPLTGNNLGKNALTLSGNFAPRIGLLYDWTKEGRSKIYGHWGRFFESVPLDINDRSFGGEVRFDQYWDPGNTANCGDPVGGIGGPDGTQCLNDPNAVAELAEFLFGSSGVLVAPGLKAQYLDETLAGVEYELMDDLKLGLALQHRTLGRVIEDVSTDNAETYIIANPGEWSEGEEQKLVDQIDDLDMTPGNGVQDDCNEVTDPDTAPQSDIDCNRLAGQLEQYQGIRIFDKPSRNYDALQFTVTRRFSKSLYVQGSYTYSKTEGNFPGLYSPNNGQVDPNISSQYDLIELLANRNGPLPNDRPHYVKLDGYYTFDLKKAGSLTVGGRFRALSGVARDALGPHWLYGPNEAFLLPRGTIGRTPFEHGLDMHFGYGRDLPKGMKIELFGDIFNIYNNQGAAGVDDTYAFAFADNGANPISGGTYEDLIWAKAVSDTGAEVDDMGRAPPLRRNPNFGNTNQRYAPLSVRFGMRLTF